VIPGVLETVPPFCTVNNPPLTASDPVDAPPLATFVAPPV
jgi:hypothetical protein